MTSTSPTSTATTAVDPVAKPVPAPIAAMPVPVTTVAKTPAKSLAKPPVKKVVAPAKKVVNPVAKLATSTTAKPTTKVVAKPTPIVVAKTAAKPVAKTVPGAAPKLAVKTTAKTAIKATPVPTTTPNLEKLLRAKKPKLVRDSFTIPKLEYLILDELKHRSGKLGNSVKKSELIRAGIKALAAMSDASFLAAMKAVPTIKTGRPAKD